ncbi:MAG: ABC transporter ATP-binding protein [Vicinamibacterales bacterium]
MATHDHSREPVTDAAFLELDGVTKRYSASVVAVDDLHLSVRAGRILGLLGPSGCGKTTVLRAIAGLVPVSAGRIRVSGADITHLPPHRRDIGLVFQNYALFPHLTVAENVAFGLEMRRLPRDEVGRRVRDSLDLVRLGGLGARRPRELSGGQQQRVALARALAIQPTILLLDEPLSNLDARLRDEMRTEIRDIQRRLGITTVFVTHDQVEALTMCDTVGVMANGRLVQLGAPAEIYERPTSAFVAGFVGRVNTIVCDVVGTGRVRIGTLELPAATGALGHGRAIAMLRPHRIRLVAPDAPEDPAATRRSGRILRTTYVGDVFQHEVDVGAVTLTVDVHVGRAGPPPAVGDAVACEWAPDDLLVFPDAAR